MRHRHSISSVRCIVIAISSAIALPVCISVSAQNVVQVSCPEVPDALREKLLAVGDSVRSITWADCRHSDKGVFIGVASLSTEHRRDFYCVAARTADGNWDLSPLIARTSQRGPMAHLGIDELSYPEFRQLLILSTGEYAQAHFLTTAGKGCGSLETVLVDIVSARIVSFSRCEMEGDELLGISALPGTRFVVHERLGLGVPFREDADRYYCIRLLDTWGTPVWYWCASSEELGFTPEQWRERLLEVRSSQQRLLEFNDGVLTVRNRDGQPVLNFKPNGLRLPW